MRRAARALTAGLLLLALAEGLARLLHEPPPVRRVYDPFAFRIPQPDLEDSFLNASGETVRVRLNELGLRGPRLAEPVAPGTLTLVFLGGSAVESYGWNEADTFTVLAGAELARRLGRPVRVFNGGMSGAVSATSLARLQHQVLGLRPDLVVVMDGINDLLGGFHPGYRPDGRHLRPPPVAGQRPRSYLLDWLRARPAWARRAPRQAARELRHLDYADFPARLVFARNLRSMAAIAEAAGVPILFLTQPTTYRDQPDAEDLRRYYLTESLIELGQAPPDVPSLAAGMRAFNATTTALPGTPLGDGRLPDPRFVRVLDLAAQVAPSYELFLDECHLTRAGNRDVAARIVGPVAELLTGAPSP
jgi:lysophospholipase L1-like esterase